MEQMVEYKRVINRAGFALFVLAVAVLCSQMLIEFLVNRFCPVVAETDWYIWALTATSMVAIGFPIYFLLMYRIPDSPKKEMVKLKPTKFIMIFFICCGAMYITNFISGILTMAIAYLKGDKQLLNPLEEAVLNGNFTLTLIYAAIVAPIFEELIFRKLLLNKLRRYGDVPAILMTGIAFGLFHMNLSQMFYAAVLGFIFAYITIRTNTIRYSILLHMMVNFIGTVVSPFAASQNKLALMILGYWMFVSTLTGIICFVFNYRSIEFNKAELFPMKKSALLLNPGTILYILLCTVGIVTITLI
jgi:membrane protease YdiL (CAAX protease family)